MLQFIVGIVVFALVLGLLAKLLPIAFKVALAALGLALAVVVGAPVALALALEKIAHRCGCRSQLAFGVITAGGAAALWIGYVGYGWRPGLDIDSLKFLLSSLLPLVAVFQHRRRLAAEREGLEISLPDRKTALTYRLLFSAIFIGYFPVAIQEFFPTLVTMLFSRSTDVWRVDLAFFVLSCLVSGSAAFYEAGYASVIAGIKKAIDGNETALNLDIVGAALHKGASQVGHDDVKMIVLGVANVAHQAGRIELFELSGAIWLFEKNFHHSAMTQYRAFLEESLRHEGQAARQQLSRYLPVPQTEAYDYFDRYVDFVEQCDFQDGTYLVAYSRHEELNRCRSCGMVQVHGGARNEDWYCTSICRETEQLCVTIKDKPLTEFLGDAAATGFLLIEMGGAWSQNHKMVATGGQGHGFAAEKANTMQDRRDGKSAFVVGDDNAKNGADRLVNGQEIQTKYCSTGARSIGAAFDNGGNGNFRYYDNDGKAMPIEVPKDQYDAAVKTMRDKIRQGKVEGVTDENQADRLVVKGHLTYEQARSITRFGTFESLKFDVQEGSIVSLSAGGISFAITATVSYLNTNDAKTALRAACLQGGKTFTRTLVVYVGTQQLHRLATVQAAVKYIDVGKMSRPMAEALQKSMGVTSRNQLNHALRGTVVASLVIVAVSSGPDLLKMVRGRMSGVQFTKNLAVTASSTAGGAVGAIAGGALGASFGPVGIWAGKFAGGLIGGAIAGAVTNSIAKSMMKEDGERMVEIIQRQVEYLALLFMLTEKEVDSLGANLNKVVTPGALESMYGSDSHKAFANFLVKPVVIGIVKQRPALRYGLDDVLDAFDGKPLVRPHANDVERSRAAA